MEASKIETRLLRSLNKFITLISSGEGSQSGQPNFRLASNFLRLNLLSSLRQYQQPALVLESAIGKERDLLVQWWITLLNYLNSDLNGNSNDQEKKQLTTEVISVSLECISRIITLIMIIPDDNDSYDRDLDIYAYHILLTVHYVTNRLVANTKRRKALGVKQQLSPTEAKGALAYINSYNSLLNSFMGKLMAFAFFYLDPALKYDYYVLKSFEPNLLAKADVFPAFPWRNEGYSPSTGDKNPEQPTGVVHNGKIFQVMISYLQNSNIFLTFYWHYWYIALRLLSSKQIQEIDFKLIPGSEILTRHVSRFLDNDLLMFRRYIKSQERDTVLLTKPHAGHSAPLSSEQLNNFVFTNFKTAKVWECLRNLIGCLDALIPDLLHSLVALHDDLQLQKIGKIPAYDSVMANLIYNKILQFIVFQFDTTLPHYLNDLNWNIWCAGIVNMLKTLNFNCQSVGLLCLFNVWRYIPSVNDLKTQLITTLIEELWDTLVANNYFDIVKVLYFKLIVFQMLSDPADYEDVAGSLVYQKLQDVYEQALALNDQAQFDFSECLENDALVFQVNKKLILCKPETTREETLIYDKNGGKPVDTRNSLLFPHMITVSSVRPTVVLHRGQYPFDVFDEMVAKAAKAAALKRKEKMSLERSLASKSSGTIKSDALGSGNSSDSFDEEGQKGLISNALESFFSKFGTSSTKMQNDSRKSATSVEKVSRGNVGIKHRNSIGSAGTSDSLGGSESVEMLSMYSTVSTVSTLSTNRSGSSLDLFNSQPQSGSDLLNQRVSQKRDDIGKSAPSPPQQKKRKLLAPPELKFSGEINDKQNITCMFRLASVPLSNSSSTLSKIRDANDKWGVVSARNYDKPLPFPHEYGSETLLEKFSFETFNDISTDNFESTLPQSSNVSDMIPGVSRKMLPRPNSTIFKSKLRNAFDADEILTLQKLSLSDDGGSIKGLHHGLQSNSFVDENIVQRGIDSSNKMYFENSSEDKKPLASFMCRSTKLDRLVKVIEAFNSTVQEWYDYSESLRSDQGGSAFMELDIIYCKGPHSNVKDTVNAKAEYF